MSRYSGWIRDERRWGIYERDSYTCCHCGTDLRERHEALSLDHLRPWAVMEAAGEKLDHSNTNLVTCCALCNSSRQDKPLEQFVPAGALVRIAVQITKRVDTKAGMRAYNADRLSRGYAVK